MAQTHTVRLGDCMASIAKQYRFADYRSIYDHTRNARLKSRRPNPNQLHPGDRVYVPDLQEGQEDRGTGALHTFETPTYQVQLRLSIQNRAGEPYAGKRYELAPEGGATVSGTTNGQGLIEETVAADLEEATLRVWLEDEHLTDPYEWRLRIGHLDPVSTTEGGQARLNNLAFHCGGVDGIEGPNTRSAVRAFQEREDREPTGRLDSDTRTILEQSHDDV